ncbi:SusF/SusE family outer membrane protein [Marivirga sp.]|uniref:SusF/SusE family outer membrane protein n=1 Tax=Marivirga sp. TaxID=2018662 RepID=UPI003DA75DEB
MKNLTKLWSLALLLTAAMFMVSCDDDEPVIDVDEDGLSVADGIYIATEGEDPVATMQLTPEQVEAEGFGAQEREGFVTGYFYLSSGDYNIVQTVDREVSATFGGSLETINYGSEEEPLTYDLIADATDGGEAFTIEEGLYKIAHDELTSEILIFKINSVGLIGAATPNGGSADTPLSGSVDENGGTWTASDIILRAGWYKFRFNTTWNVDRRVDPAAGFAADNGYMMFTNFGGSIDNLAPGNVGGNFEMSSDNEGVYDIEVAYAVDGGFSFSQERTGDAPEITFDPEEYKWAFVGNATADNWGEFNDRNLVYKGDEGGTHTWVGAVTFVAEGEFKFRANDAWDVDLGGSLPADGSEVSLTPAGANIPSPGAGAYYVVITTSDEGETWNASMTDAGWGIIGEGSPVGNWDADQDLTADGFADGVATYSITGDFTTGEWKFRAGDDWALNIGGSLEELTVDGGNLSLSEAGNYTVTLSFDGNNYSATATKN